jgi:hypothetical protein
VNIIQIQKLQINLFITIDNRRFLWYNMFNACKENLRAFFGWIIIIRRKMKTHGENTIEKAATRVGAQTAHGVPLFYMSFKYKY